MLSGFSALAFSGLVGPMKSLQAAMAFSFDNMRATAGPLFDKTIHKTKKGLPRHKSDEIIKERFSLVLFVELGGQLFGEFDLSELFDSETVSFDELEDLLIFFSSNRIRFNHRESLLHCHFDTSFLCFYFFFVMKTISRTLR
eukprot:TRINITY_DN4205_c0_g1_i1.p1 TRINITY_DN4205_c0_g1~~TRINITY_DN4205_c0_g1_i1.p1  ORF type:complete len:142 (-),score=16.22 TRINITY_DN4205_c0_g1_i1:4-429(-)